MIQPRSILLLALLLLGLPWASQGQRLTDWVIEPLTGDGAVEYDFETDIATATNGVIVKYGDAVLTADRVAVSQSSGEVVADGMVRIQQGAQVWASEHVRYNFKTRQMRAEQFRTGKTPVFAAGENLTGDISNRVYSATNAVITADDIAKPAIKVRARSIRIIPDKKIEARHATLYAGPIPIFYFPYYSRTLGPQGHDLNVVPGYRSRFGAFALGTYTWMLNDHLDGVVHMDYRLRRGPGVGPDFNYHLGQWGEGSLRYYYTYDRDPSIESSGLDIPNNRQRLDFSYQAHPATNLTVLGRARYQSDPTLIRDFFEDEHRQNPQPSSFLEVNKAWQNFSVDAYAQPRVNDFLETVERLPDVRITGFRQQLANTPVYYESESSAGYYRRLFPETNAPFPANYEAARADTYHQVILPQTLFGWLNVAPRAGGRFTYYTEASGPGSYTSEVSRGVFNTGAEVSFKASRLWPDVRNSTFELDGLRHIFEPSVNYVYVPEPSAAPAELPQFDYVLPSLRLLPMEFPDFNAIDAIDSTSVLRLGMRNRLQTRRQGTLANLLNWSVYADWRLDRSRGQAAFSDLFSDMVFRPRSWLVLESMNRYDVEGGQWRMALETVTLQPNDILNWTAGYFYLRDNYNPPPDGWGQGNNLVLNSVLVRLNPDWALRATQHYDIIEGRMQRQAYTIYRDLRSWTAALSFRITEDSGGSKDYTVAFTFSLKAYPRYGVGGDTPRPYSLLGG